MKKKIDNTLIYILLCGFMACQSDLAAPIAQDKLIKVLVDIHTAEGLLETETQNIRDSMTRIYYAQILEKHQTNQVDFDSTMAIYSRNPIQFDTVYNRVLRIVGTQRDSFHKR